MDRLPCGRSRPSMELQENTFDARGISSIVSSC
jgi:hypothetical protein